MVDGYRLSVKNGRKVDTYLYPQHGDLRCFVDAIAALLLGRCILIEPPGADAWEGGLHDVGDRSLAALSPGGAVLEAGPRDRRD